MNANGRPLSAGSLPLKAAQAAQKPDSGKPSDGLYPPYGLYPRLPLMLEVIFSTARLLVIAAGVLVMLLSLISGAALWMSALRSGLAMLSIGLLLWLTNWLVARQALEATRLELLAAIEAERSARLAEAEAALGLNTDGKPALHSVELRA